MTRLSSQGQWSHDDSFIRDRLGNAIADEARRCGGYKQLSQGIESASPQSHTVDRRKLSKLVANDGVHLSIEDLDALEHYFRQQRGYGLGAILSFSNTVISQVAEESREVTFLLGARPDTNSPRQLQTISRWDVRAMADVLGAIFRATSKVKIGIDDVLLRCEPLSSRSFKTAFGNDPWYQSLRRKDSPSKLCIGSARSCHATEVMLAKMFGVQPFDESVHRKLPFRFLWPSQYAGSASSFASEANLRHKRTTGHDILGLQLLDREPMWVDRSQQSWRTYGVVAAQKRKFGQVWLVTAGLTAPGTLAAASQLEFLTGQIPQEPNVLWGIVAADVQWSPNGEKRRMSGPSILRDGDIWKPQ